MLFRSKISSLREYLTPINHALNFTTTGEISPEEFVRAGDYLVYKFPTWQWQLAPDKLRKDFLPADKQYLITKHVPLYQRCADYLGVTADGEEEEEVDEDGWVKSKSVAKVDKSSITNRLNDLSIKEDVSASVPAAAAAAVIDDLDDFIDEDAEYSDNDIVEASEADEEFQHLGNCNSTLRKYDLYITYLTSYRVPKLYLVGFNLNGIPLLPKQMFEDILGDYRDKTATIENLPVSFHTTSVSIHPCRHASVMKVLMAHVRQKDQENPGEIDVDHYLVIFLKFIASVTPGIEYDYTMDAL